MFKKESIQKAKKLLNDRIAFYAKVQAVAIKMCISTGNKKIGNVLNVSLPPIISCGNCKECMKLCYDIKAVLQYANTVVDARARNYALLKKDRNEYFRRIAEKCRRRRKNKYFRWHVAGDIVDMDYLERMIQIAIEFPEFKFWTYTKMYMLVNMYCDAHGGKSAIPSNLSIMFSEWRGMPMINPYGFPEFRVVFKGEKKPENVFFCPGNCDLCKEGNLGCIGGNTTYCDEH